MKFGDFSYGEYSYGDSKRKDDRIKEDIYDLSKYLPVFLFKKNRGSEENTQKNEMDVLFKDVFPRELFILREEVQRCRAQMVLSTADSDGLDYWEEMLGMEKGNSEGSESDRKSMVKARLRGFGTTNGNLIKQIAETYSKGEAEVIEIPKERYFIVKFTGIQGKPKKIQELSRNIRELKPAHLRFKFAYTYCRWYWTHELGHTWKTIREFTWNKCKTELNRNKGGFQNAFSRCFWYQTIEEDYNWDQIKIFAWKDCRTELDNRRDVS